MPLGKLLCAVKSTKVSESRRESLQEERRKSEAQAESVNTAEQPAEERKSRSRNSKRLSEKVRQAAVDMITKSSTGTNGFAEAIAMVSPAVVVLQTNYSRAFEGDSPGSSTATGFVVDKKRGIILTNRHVVTNGPVRASATFINKEEVKVEPIYADPVHDFGFFRFNPSDVKFLDVVEVPLAPERARVGIEIRVVGNDAGEQLQILAGTLARLDRDAPMYTSGVYSDFNTFYYSAASSTSGGSSGSPVIDSSGFAVALNAGARTGTASSYYFPLHRAVRALKCLQNDEMVPRGTVQAIFRHVSFSEAQRLGLPDETQATVREKFPQATGMLIVDVVVGSGPAAAAGLKPGDIVVKLNGNCIHEFLPLEEAMDEMETLTFLLQRGTEQIFALVGVDDLHELAPREFLEISDAIVHPLSYHQAIKSQLPIGSVMIATPGYMFRRARLSSNNIILAVGDEETPDLKSLVKALSKYPDLSKVSIRAVHMTDRFREVIVSVEIDRTWFLWRHGRRVFEDGIIKWEYSDVPAPSLDYTKPSRTLRIRSALAASLVVVNFNAPFYIDGLATPSWIGTGIVVDLEEGLVVVDRGTVPNALGNCSIIFGSSYEIPATVVFVHPMQNFSVIQYDTSMLHLEMDDSVSQLEMEESDVPLLPGSVVTFAGYSHQLNLISQKCNVTMIDRYVPFPPNPPKFCARNQTVVRVDKIISNLGGVLLDADGRCQAFWFGFSSTDFSFEGKTGIPSYIVFDTIRKFRGMWGSPHTVPTLAVDLNVVHMAQAGAMGVSEQWAEDLYEADPSNNHVLSVRSVMAGSNSSGSLKSGDLLLAVDGKPLTDLHQVDANIVGKDSVEVTYVRNLHESTVEVPVTWLSSIGTDRVVLFAGMTLHAPHPEVAFTGFLPEECEGKGVYCSFWYYGSPSDLYGMEATSFIVGINDDNTPTLDDFLDAVGKVGDTEFMRIRTVSLNGQPDVVTLRPDRYFWPTIDLHRDPKSMRWKLSQVD